MTERADNDEKLMDIDEKLMALVVKYRIFDADKRLYDVYKPMIARMVFNEIMEGIPDGAVIALRGNGEHTHRLLAAFTEENRSRVAYIVDKEYGYQTEGGGNGHPSGGAVRIWDTIFDIVVAAHEGRIFAGAAGIYGQGACGRPL